MSEPAFERRAPWAVRWGASIVVAILAFVTAACVGSLWFVDAAGRAIIAGQQQEAAETELDLLVEEQRDDGDAALLHAVERRVRVDDGRRHRLYALRGADGRLRAGNLPAWPEGVGDDEAWRPATLTAAGAVIHVATRSLDGGEALLVGRDAAALEIFRRRIVDAGLVAVTIVAVTCLMMAIAVTALLLARVRRLAGAAEKVSAGDFSARAESANDGGPFGQIARAQNLMLDRIEDLVTGLVTVTDSLAHDLRTPLARTRRRIEEGMLSSDERERQDAFADALAETDKTIATFTALIDIARAEGGLSRDAMQQVDAAKVVADAYELFEPLAEERRVSMAVHTAASAQILGHRPLLMQAVSNLIHNGLTYSPEGGHVDIAVTATPEQVEIVVSDNGPGIPAADRAAAVQRFKQAANANPEGLGLGLAIVEACARLHRGSLLLEDNAPGLRARLVLARR